MNDKIVTPVTSRRAILKGAGALALGSFVRFPADAGAAIAAQGDPLPSWNDGPAKQAILDFVAAATNETGASHVPAAERIAVFDQDGTLWVEHPIYTQAVFALARLRTLAPQHPEWKTQAPYAALLAGDKDAIAKLSEQDWEQIVAVTHAGMAVADFQTVAADWMATAIDPHFGHRYADLIYQPMSEVMTFLRANGFKTYIVSGGGQGFIRSYAESVYGVPPEQVIGSTFATKYEIGGDGAPALIKQPALQLNDNNGGKPEAINLIIGRRPVAAFGNSTGDQQMLEWTGAGDRAHLEMLVLHDDAAREYAYGPANGLPETSVGTFTDALMAEATAKGWTVVSMRRDWARIFPWSVAATPTA